MNLEKNKKMVHKVVLIDHSLIPVPRAVIVQS